MDPFSTFPREVIVSILEFCADFASLDGLLRASAQADQVFGVNMRNHPFEPKPGIPSIPVVAPL